MKNKESRRIVPVSAITLAVLCFLFLFEALVIGGAIGIEASTVAKVVPWAYEPFLRLVGEHPDDYAERNAASSDSDIASDESSFDPVTGLNSGMLMADTNAPPADTEEIDSSKPDAGQAEEENAPEPIDDETPVG